MTLMAANEVSFCIATQDSGGKGGAGSAADSDANWTLASPPDRAGAPECLGRCIPKTAGWLGVGPEAIRDAVEDAREGLRPWWLADWPGEIHPLLHSSVDVRTRGVRSALPRPDQHASVTPIMPG